MNYEKRRALHSFQYTTDIENCNQMSIGIYLLNYQTKIFTLSKKNRTSSPYKIFIIYRYFLLRNGVERGGGGGVEQ